LLKDYILKEKGTWPVLAHLSRTTYRTHPCNYNSGKISREEKGEREKKIDIIKRNRHSLLYNC
jgi:hypothetical protein